MPTSEKLVITPEQPLDTEALRHDPQTATVYEHADPAGELPHILIAPSADPTARNSSSRQALALLHQGRTVGSLNLVQAGERTWINNTRIDDGEQGKKFAAAAYVGIVAAQQARGRTLESDRQGINEGGKGIWQSLVRRGLAETTGEHDVHGNPRFLAKKL